MTPSLTPCQGRPRPIPLSSEPRAHAPEACARRLTTGKGFVGPQPCWCRREDRMEDRRNNSKHPPAHRHDRSADPHDVQPEVAWSRAFKALDQCNVNWVLLRDAPRRPGVTGDVDILVTPVSGRDLDRTLASAGFLRVPPRGRGSHRFVLRVREIEFCAYDAGADAWHDLDVLTEVSFGPDLQFRTGLAEHLLARKRYVDGVATLHPTDEFFYLLLHELLKSGDVAPYRRERISALASMSDPTSPVAEEIERVSPGSAVRLREAALSGQWHGVRSIGEGIRQGWRRRRPFQVGVVAAVSKVTQFLPARAPVGISVAILGPDGAGKTTLASSLRRTVPMPCVYVYLGVWRDNRFETTLRHVIGARLAVRLVALLGKSVWIQLQRRLGRLVLLDRYTSDAALPKSLGLERAHQLDIGPADLRRAGPGHGVGRPRGGHVRPQG